MLDRDEKGQEGAAGSCCTKWWLGSEPPLCDPISPVTQAALQAPRIRSCEPCVLKAKQLKGMGGVSREENHWISGDSV